jgi:acyl-CoA thioesterase
VTSPTAERGSGGVALLGLERTADPSRFRLPVRPANCSGGNFLFGGAALATAIEALETVTGRPLLWATSQFVSYARPPEVVELEVTIAAGGHALTQARCTGRVEGKEIFMVSAALGARTFAHEGQWATMPDAPPPDACLSGAAPRAWTLGESVATYLDIRLARGRLWEELDGQQGDGRAALWVRVPGEPMSASLLGLLGDWIPFGIGQALGLPAGGNSLDNTIRVVRIVPTEWVLLDIHVVAVANGVGHGYLHLWAEDGTLLATASQSMIARLHVPPPE